MATAEKQTRGRIAVKEDEAGFLTREQILGAEDVLTADVFVPEWGGKVRVRAMTVAERDRWERLATGNLSKEDQRLFGGMKLTANHTRAVVIWMCAVDPVDGARLFPAPTDVMQLSRKSAAPVVRLFDEIIKLSKVSDEDVEDVEKAFDENPTSAPSTSLQKSSTSGT